jgi:hypothetical protein
VPTPTDELNRLLDAVEFFAYKMGEDGKVTRSETDPDLIAARAAIVAHFETVTLTPEEANSLEVLLDQQTNSEFYLADEKRRSGLTSSSCSSIGRKGASYMTRYRWRGGVVCGPQLSRSRGKLCGILFTSATESCLTRG